ncbi:MAG: RNA polymerase sigma factor [Patescibacteria group bacterium]|nr:RNA polymerase sigma factor [Patescibacteria group bacterium]
MNYGTETDEALVAACKSGDDTAFGELMKRYTKPILAFVRQYAGNDDEADDIAQDAFFKAWRHIKRFSEGRAWRPWLYTIARNTSLDHIKKRRASVFSDLDDESGELVFSDTLEDEEPLPHEIFERQELAAELEEAMRVLHPDHRAVIIMHYRDDMTFDEIAETMDKPMNTVKSWHRRALAKLKPRLPGRQASLPHRK